MCTAVSVVANNHYFGRNLDYEHDFGEKIVITPRHYPFIFSNGEKTTEHYGIIGMGISYKNYPLYFDGVNEKGLCMAGLYFPKSAVYCRKKKGKENIASFELIPKILSSFDTVEKAVMMLENANITNEAFDEQVKPSPLHWILADKTRTVTLEQTEEGFKIYENPAGVLANNPPFSYHLFNLQNYMNISCEEAVNFFSDKIPLQSFSKGMGAFGLPGDFSSVSRFVKACFTGLNTSFGNEEAESVHQFFHILHSVYQLKGCVRTEKGSEITYYSSCINAEEGIYYYTTHYNSKINGVNMHREDLDAEDLIVYELERKGALVIQN